MALVCCVFFFKEDNLLWDYCKNKSSHNLINLYTWISYKSKSW